MNAHSCPVAASDRGAISGLPATGRDASLAGGLLAIATTYATLRYNVFKGVPWADWPAYTLNKAIAVGSLLILAASVLRLARRGRGAGVLMAWSGVLALAHSLLSFALFDPGYYPRLFEDGKLTAVGGLSITLGAVLTAVMELGARRSAIWPPQWRRSALALVAFGAGLHAALPALQSWVEPGTWPGSMPPLTLISFLTGLVALAALWLRPRNRAA